MITIPEVEEIRRHIERWHRERELAGNPRDGSQASIVATLVEGSGVLDMLESAQLKLRTIRKLHRPFRQRGLWRLVSLLALDPMADGHEYCNRCQMPWPCTEVKILDDIIADKGN